MTEEALGNFHISITHGYRIGQTDDWIYDTVSYRWWTAEEPAEQDFGGDYYSIGGGLDITGASIGAYHCYAIVIDMGGVLPPYGYSDVFDYESCGECIPGTDPIEVSGTFSHRPDELVPQADPTHGMIATPVSLKNR